MILRAVPNWRIVRRIRRWVTPRAANPDRALQERAVYALALPLFVMAAVFGLIDLAFLILAEGRLDNVVVDLVFLATMAATYALARRGRVRWSIVLLLGINLLAVAFYIVQGGYQSINAMLFVLSIVAAGLALGARMGFAIALLSSLVYGALVWAQSAGRFTPNVVLSADETVLNFALISFLLAGLTAVFGSWIYRTQRDQARLLAEQMQALQAADEEKNALLRALETRIVEQQALLDRLEISDAAQARLATELRQTASPVIPVFDEVVVMPVAGTLDAARAQGVLNDLLDGIERHGARLALLDITGAPGIDEQVADVLLQAIDAVGLLGAECVLVGVRPEMARAMINLGIDLSSVVTRRDLQSGIEYALGRMGRRIETVR
ncbi:MAG: STAS domain-containing protein [Anaerolineae bacterium]|nr:STAS domain-containing protein [Anaerolineae bacterium]